jgi:glucose/arabinose dehydrogenase
MSGTIALTGTEFSVLETDSGLGIRVSRTGDASRPVTVEYLISIDGSGANDASAADVGLGSGFATIPADADGVTIDIPILDDGLTEGTETFFLSLVGVDSGTLLFPRTARIDIIDDELPEYGTAEPPLTSPYTVTETNVFTGLSQPMALEFSPLDGNQVYVAEKGGVVSVYDLAAGTRIGTLFDIRDKVNETNDRGLLDIALHPDLANNPYLYAFYVVDPPETVGRFGNDGPDGQGNRYSHVVRYELDADTNYQTIVDGSEVILLGAAGQSLSDISGNGAVDSTSSSNAGLRDSEIDPDTGTYKTDYLKVDSLSHAGGSLAFGPDGALYVSVGDGTSYNLTDRRSVSVQDIDSLSGKILRVDPITGQGLADNPFVTEAGGNLDANAAKVWQLGFRNPFSMGFDDDGQLFITNTGWTNFESIFTGGPGANFGWPFYEGDADGTPRQAPGYNGLPEAQAFYDAVAAGTIDITAPYRSFSHASSDPGFQVQAITGADSVIDTDKVPAGLQGHYIFTDVVQGEVFSVDTDDRRDVQFLYRSSGPYAPVHFKQGPDGEIYYADLVLGVIGRLTIADGSQPPPDPTELTFGGSTYVILDDGLSRAEAQAQAAALGGTLLRIGSQAEQDWVTANIWNQQAIYLDASDAATEGVWVDSDGTPLAYTNWMPGEPNDSGGQDYAIVATPDGRWDDQGRDGSVIFADRWFGTAAMSVVEIAGGDPPPDTGGDPPPDTGGDPPPDGGDPPPAGLTFGGSTYVILDDGLSRAEAQAQAAALGGTLLRIGSQAEQDWVTANIWNQQAIYLDASDAATEGVWVDSDGTPLAYTNWMPGEPNDGGGQDYAIIARGDGGWDDQGVGGADIFTDRWTGTAAMSVVEIAGGDPPPDTGGDPPPDGGDPPPDTGGDPPPDTGGDPPPDGGDPPPAGLTFGGSTYVILDDGLSRAEAQAQAAALGGTLLRIGSQAEQDWVTANIWNQQAIYLDASDAATEGVWVDSDGTPLAYTNWMPGEPNDGGGQDYAIIARGDGGWDDQGVDGADIFTDRWTGTAAMSVVEIAGGDPPPDTGGDPPPDGGDPPPDGGDPPPDGGDPPPDTGGDPPPDGGDPPPAGLTFGGSTYFILSDGLTRAEALAEAAARGGTLLSIDSQAEQDWVMENLWNDQIIFLDASDEAVEGTFVDSDGAPLAYTNWLPGEPNNSGGNQDYALLASSDGGWDDQNENESVGLIDGAWQFTESMTVIEVQFEIA